MEKVATFVKTLSGFVGDARLYKVRPGVKYTTYTAKGKKAASTTYVVVSGINGYSGTETYSFPANKEGKVIDWGELKGSFRGGIDHEKALAGAGYKVKND